MAIISRSVALLTILSVSPTALACSIQDTPTFRQELVNAKNIFIFRLTSLTLLDPKPGSTELVGSIEIIRTLKGSSESARQLTYQNSFHCALHLEVGHYYMAITTHQETTLQLSSGDRWIMDITQDYVQNYPPLREDQKLQWHIENYIRGIPLPATFMDQEYTAETSGILPPPPSPPPPPEPEHE